MFIILIDNKEKECKLAELDKARNEDEKET